MRKVTDLLEDALNCPDYDQRINFLLAGLLSEEANDTPEKETVNRGYLKDIYEFCYNYKGDKGDYINRIADSIRPYIEE